MLETIILALALLLGTAGSTHHIGGNTPAGGIPIPQTTPGTGTAPGLN